MKRANIIHLKYVDDLSLAQAFNLHEKLKVAPNIKQPDNFHARTGHFMPIAESQVLKQ